MKKISKIKKIIESDDVHDLHCMIKNSQHSSYYFLKKFSPQFFKI
jgi:hypothetical protein